MGALLTIMIVTGSGVSHAERKDRLCREVADLEANLIRPDAELRGREALRRCLGDPRPLGVIARSNSFCNDARMVLKKGRRGERLSDYECRSEAPVYVSARPPRTWKPRTSTRTHQRYCRRLSVAVKNMPRRTAYRACLRDPDTHFGVLLVPAKPTSGAHH